MQCFAGSSAVVLNAVGHVLEATLEFQDKLSQLVAHECVLIIRMRLKAGRVGSP